LNYKDVALDLREGEIIDPFEHLVSYPIFWLKKIKGQKIHRRFLKTEIDNARKELDSN